MRGFGGVGPRRDLNHWRSSSSTETRAIGTWNSLAPIRVMRSKRSSALVSSICNARSVSSRCCSSDGVRGSLCIMLLVIVHPCGNTEIMS
jgi:hypothetical protein